MSSQFEKLLILTLEEEILKELGDVLGNIIDIIRERLPEIVSHCKERAITLSRESKETLSDTNFTKSSNSGVESIFDKPERPQSASIRPSIDMDESDRNLFAIPLDDLQDFPKTIDFNGFGVERDGLQDSFDPWGVEIDYDWDSLFGSIEATTYPI